MSGGAEAHARLAGPLVAPVLKVDDALASPQLFLTELSHILGRLLRSNAWLAEVAALLDKGDRSGKENALTMLCFPQI